MKIRTFCPSFSLREWCAFLYGRMQICRCFYMTIEPKNFIQSWILFVTMLNSKQGREQSIYLHETYFIAYVQYADAVTRGKKKAIIHSFGPFNELLNLTVWRKTLASRYLRDHYLYYSEVTTYYRHNVYIYLTFTQKSTYGG